MLTRPSGTASGSPRSSSRSWSAYGVDQLMQYATGGGEIAFYGRTTTGDHATLEFMVAAVGISMAMLRTRRTPGALVAGDRRRHDGRRRSRSAAMRGSSSATVFAVFLLLSGANRRRTSSRSSASWPRRDHDRPDLVVARLGRAADQPRPDRDQAATNVYAATNQGHINEILDGWDQIRAHPLVGLGVGVTYHRHTHGALEGRRRHGAQRRRSRCGSSSPPRLPRLLRRSTSSSSARSGDAGTATGYSDLLALGGGSFLLGQFFVIATVYAWPFGVWEKAILDVHLIAMMFPPASAVPAQPEPRADARADHRVSIAGPDLLDVPWCPVVRLRPLPARRRSRASPQQARHRRVEH